jgi:hypothetical protein
MFRYLLASFLTASIGLFSCTNAQPSLPQEGQQLLTDTTTTSVIQETPDTIQAQPPVRLAADPYLETTADSIPIIYKKLKSNVERQRSKLAQKYAKARTDSARKSVRAQAYPVLLEALSNDIWPVWYGTGWDYNGYTHKPRNGEIACGYFVSTTVRDCGFEMNRYDIAKKYSHSIVKTLCDNDRIQMIRNSDTTALFEYIASQPDDVYVIGLDNHVGFMLKNSDGIFFVHSSYYDPNGVAKETAGLSSILASSDLFVLGHLATNDDLLHNWLTKSYVAVIE